MSKQNRRPYIYFPLLLSVTLILGIYLGIEISATSGNAGDPLLSTFGRRNFNKLNAIINYVEEQYVDSVERDYLVNRTIENLLQDLDPHSYYISPEEVAALNEPLQGNFEGIGVEFSIQKDTVVVIAPVVGGPSETLGIEAGDRIVEVEGQSIAGTGIRNKEVIEMLRGKEGSEVEIAVLRKGSKELIPFTVTRGKIPIFSIDVSYMVEDAIGYMKVSRFSKTTYDEFMEAGNKLHKQGMKQLILDLRGNGGGYLETAIDMADEFLPSGRTILYTQGKAHAKKTYDATSKGSFEDVELIVLINEGSASASEIVAGAIQDNDRGTIVGRRSFGKGLVQEQTSWPDSSAVRLTIARYYTPSGRCIQKPYSGAHGNYDEYYENTDDPYSKPDSVTYPDSLRFTTVGGRTVYGGGGITPDIFVPADTAGQSFFFTELMYRGLIRQFAFEYSDREREQLSTYDSPKTFQDAFAVEGDLFDSFLEYSIENGVGVDASGLERSGDLIRNRLKADIARYIWNNDGFYPIIHQTDNVIARSRELLQTGSLNAELAPQ